MDSILLTLALTALILLFISRYSIAYLWRVEGIRQEICYMNSKLSSSANVESEFFTLSQFSKKAFLTEEDYMIHQKFLANLRYKKVVDRYDLLIRYKKRFWRFEGVLYLIAIVVTTWFLMK